MLEELGLASWLKTSGGKGLHVVAPLLPEYGHAEAKRFAKAVVEHLARTIPQRFVVKSGPRNRVGKVFVDYLRNGQSQTTVAAFSARARPGMGVSMTLAWDELRKVGAGDQWNIVTAVKRLDALRKDPWAGYWECRQSLQSGWDRLGR
jgi:bifunctional non-homologous end joining protein LigD